MSAPVTAWVPELRPAQALLIACTLAAGLPLDMLSDFAGQTALGVAVWAVMLGVIGRYPARARWTLLACLSIATAGELLLSLDWGLYAYRLGNVPLYVPPGHVLLLLLGLALARRMTDAVARAIVGGAAAYTIAAAIAGFDTFGIALFLVLVAAWAIMPSQRRLFASTFVLALALEVCATQLGNWAWSAQVPGTILVTTNPPGASGAFYCVLDMLVALALAAGVPRVAARPA